MDHEEKVAVNIYYNCSAALKNAEVTFRTALPLNRKLLPNFSVMYYPDKLLYVARTGEWSLWSSVTDKANKLVEEARAAIETYRLCVKDAAGPRPENTVVEI